jgi:hypothetical protein
MNPPKPNTNLKKAVARYNKATTKKWITKLSR